MKGYQVSRRGIDLCVRCATESNSRRGQSQIENVQNDAGYIRRVRACTNCGQTWATGEVSLPHLKKLLLIEKKISELSRHARDFTQSPNAKRRPLPDNSRGS